jgi:hypothetical protein
MLHHSPCHEISQLCGTVLHQMDKVEIIPNSDQLSRPLVGRNWNKLNVSVLLQQERKKMLDTFVLDALYQIRLKSEKWCRGSGGRAGSLTGNGVSPFPFPSSRI